MPPLAFSATGGSSAKDDLSKMCSAFTLCNWFGVHIGKG